MLIAACTVDVPAVPYRCSVWFAEADRIGTRLAAGWTLSIVAATATAARPISASAVTSVVARAVDRRRTRR